MKPEYGFSRAKRGAVLSTRPTGQALNRVFNFHFRYRKATNLCEPELRSPWSVYIRLIDYKTAHGLTPGRNLTGIQLSWDRMYYQTFGR